MSVGRSVLAGLVVALLGAASVIALPAGAASAAPAQATFAGTITNRMAVNNGTNTGSIPAGTAYTGTVEYDTNASVATVAYGGGTHTVYPFTKLTFTIGTSTATTTSGRIDVFDNVLTSTGYPTGDSVYVNFTGSVAPSGLLAGADFNWMGLAFLDPSAKAVTAAALPALNGAAFSTMFSEFNFGTAGTRWGAGNTSMIQSLTSANDSTVGATPLTFAPALPDGTVGAAYSSTLPAAAGGVAPISYSASNLPPGLALSGSTVSGTPTTAGAYDVTLSATDAAGTVVSAVVTVTVAPAPSVVCSGTNGVITSYVARNPGYIVVNGGNNLLDHLWTTNLNPSNTTFNGGLLNWFQTGLIVSWTGTADPAGCILDSLTVSPAVSVATASLPNGTVGSGYSAPVAAQWGVAPYSWSVAGLPAGLTFNGTSIVGTPQVAGTSSVTLTVTDAVGATSAQTLSLTVDPAAPSTYTIKDESKGKITAIGPNAGYLMVGTKKLIWNSSTRIIVNTPNGALSVIDPATVKVGMRVQWKGLRDRLTNTVLTSQLEVN